MQGEARSDLFSLPVLWRPRRLLQNHENLLQPLQVGLSVLASVSVLLGLAFWHEHEVDQQYRTLAVIVTLAMIVVYEWRGVFRQFKGRIDGALRLLRAWSLVVLTVIVTIFLTKLGNEFSRKVILEWAITAYILQIAGYQISYKVAQKLKFHYGKPIRSAIIGSRWLAEHLSASFSCNTWMPDHIVGIIDDDPEGLKSWKFKPSPYLGTFSELHRIISTKQITRVYIALPISCSSVIDWLCKELSQMTVDVIWVPDIFAMRLLNHSVRELNGLPLISLSESPLTSETQALSKTSFDKVVALLALIALSPLMLVIALLVRTSSPGPVIFRQKRNGWDGSVIEVWKFRSMYMHDDAKVVQQASSNDSRVTPIGRFIRRTSIDELPQLFNVLQGRMSIVGPRPHAISHNDFYAKKIRAYQIRHRIKPGITGWAQINGYRGETETVEKMLRRVELDVEYINKWSLGFDLLILLKTPISLLRHRAY
jgi:putative colanic acid biosynthesis UDP-glucose lipid carrier transferase